MTEAANAFGIANVLYVNEDYEEALKNYTQAISLQDSVEYRSCRAACNLKLGRTPHDARFFVTLLGSSCFPNLGQHSFVRGLSGIFVSLGLQVFMFAIFLSLVTIAGAVRDGTIEMHLDHLNLARKALRSHQALLHDGDDDNATGIHKWTLADVAGKNAFNQDDPVPKEEMEHKTQLHGNMHGRNFVPHRHHKKRESGMEFRPDRDIPQN
eukprot:symbB.v1.2.036375.t1/scaffold5120.1/size30669/2